MLGLTLEICEAVGQAEHDGYLGLVVIDRRTFQFLQHRGDGILGFLVRLRQSQHAHSRRSIARHLQAPGSAA